MILKTHMILSYHTPAPEATPILFHPKLGQLKTLGTQMGYPIGVPIWVPQKNKSIKIIDNVVMVINN